MEWLARLQRLADIRICKEMIEEVLMAGMWTEVHYRNIITNLKDGEKSLRLRVKNYLKDNRDAEEYIVAMEMGEEASTKRMEKVMRLKRRKMELAKYQRMT